MGSSDPIIPVVYFDGVCNLCNSAVQFIIRHDPKGKLRFASLQSPQGQQCLATFGQLPPPDSIILQIGSEIYVESTAALHIARRLSFPWFLLYGFLVVPRVVRDGVYRWIARNRYRWFGKRQECMIPSPALQQRFLS